jgi:hypothetical protein
VFAVPVIAVPEPNANPAAPHSTFAKPAPLSVHDRSAEETVRLEAVKAVTGAHDTHV